jgi:hypothetical protein
MAYQKVSGQRKYFKYAECTAGQKLVEDGTYKGIEEGTYGPQYIFNQKNGDIVVLNKAGHLSWLIDKYLKTGQLCNVYYKGMGEPLSKGPFKGKEPHTFDLEVDDGSTGDMVKHSEPMPMAGPTVEGGGSGITI